MRLNRKFLGVAVKPTNLNTPSTVGKKVDTKSALWDLNDVHSAIKDNKWTFNFINSSVAGLGYNWFNGDWRSTISTGNIGTLPLGSLVATSISYGSRGDLYGFIAIGYFKPPTTGTYTFYTSSDDGSGVWVGTIALPGQTRTTANATLNNGLGVGQGDTKRSGTIALTANVWYPIRIVHEEGTGGDNLTFSWAGPGIAETTALGTYFRTYASGGVSLGDYVPFTFD